MKESKKKWLITPGLIPAIQKFETLVKVSEGKPLIIMGPSGAGKSLFTHIFLKIKEQETRDKGEEMTGKIQIVNCASFSEALIESELFGHVEGAFTGAKKSRAGHLKKADGGFLILEEVGELSKSVQAKLNTFAEDGYFYPVGSEQRDRAEVQVVCTTNRDPNSMKFDFTQRFLQFHVPGLHERRQDILYLLTVYLPEIMKELRPWEVFNLLNYHWPGNAREFTGLFVPEVKAAMMEGPQIGNEKGFFSSVTCRYIKRHGLEWGSFLETVSSLNAETKAKLHQKMAPYLGLDMMEEKQAFRDVIEYDSGQNLISIPEGFAKWSDFENRYEVDTFGGVDAFEKTYRELVLTCLEFSEFLNSPFENGPLLKEQPVTDEGAFIDKLTSFPFPEIEKMYFEGLYHKTKGNKAEAARQAGVDYNVIRKNVKKFNLDKRA